MIWSTRGHSRIRHGDIFFCEPNTSWRKARLQIYIFSKPFFVCNLRHKALRNTWIHDIIWIVDDLRTRKINASACANKCTVRVNVALFFAVSFFSRFAIKLLFLLQKRKTRYFILSVERIANLKIQKAPLVVIRACICLIIHLVSSVVDIVKRMIIAQFDGK